jgi:hypothetical protein
LFWLQLCDTCFLINPKEGWAVRWSDVVLEHGDHEIAFFIRPNPAVADVPIWKRPTESLLGDGFDSLFRAGVNAKPPLTVYRTQQPSHEAHRSAVHGYTLKGNGVVKGGV